MKWLAKHRNMRDRVRTKRTTERERERKRQAAVAASIASTIELHKLSEKLYRLRHETHWLRGFVFGVAAGLATAGTWAGTVVLVAAILNTLLLVGLWASIWIVERKIRKGLRPKEERDGSELHFIKGKTGPKDGPMHFDAGRMAIEGEEPAKNPKGGSAPKRDTGSRHGVRKIGDKLRDEADRAQREMKQ